MDHRGCPVALVVFEGPTADPKTWLPPVETVRDRFGIRALVLVGDRGRRSQSPIERRRPSSGVEWITARRCGAIRTLREAEALPLAPGEPYPRGEVVHPDSPQERGLAGSNPRLARQRDPQRPALGDATRQELEQVQGLRARGQWTGPEPLGGRAGKVITKYQMANHVALTLDATPLQVQVNAHRVAAERALAGR